MQPINPKTTVKIKQKQNPCKTTRISSKLHPRPISLKFHNNEQTMNGYVAKNIVNDPTLPAHELSQCIIPVNFKEFHTSTLLYHVIPTAAV